MNAFDKPKLIDRSFLKKLVNKNLTKQKYINIELWDFIKQYSLILLFIGLIIYVLYYRYNLVQNKKEEEEEIVVQEAPIQPPVYTRNRMVNPQTRQQTRFIPETQQYSAPTHPIQDRYDVNGYVSENTFNPDEIPNPQMINNINPINLNHNYLEEKQSQPTPQFDEMDYSLKSRSATFLSPQYIGPNFAPAK